MNINSLPLRIFAAGLPLIVIALIAGAAGYMSKGTQREPVPPLPAEASGSVGVYGTVQDLSGDQLVIIDQGGTQQTFGLTADAVIEILTPMTPAELAMGGWINGGAIPHAQTTLVLTGLVLIEDPVVKTP